jgi:hydrogenase nickel incorporation protein HypA/HybF
MHELSATQGLLDTALKHAPTQKITALYIVVGQASSMVDESVQFYFDQISAGTRAAGARLHFRRIPAEMRCMDCQHVFLPEPDQVQCSHCQGRHLHLASGQEFYLEAIDVDE